jgi:undecaprenyl-diphosphatase
MSSGWSAARPWIIAFVVAAVVAVVSGIIASDGDVPGWEESLFEAVNDLPDWLEGPMWVFQLAGLLFTPLVLAIVAAVLRRWRVAIALVLLIPLKLIVEKAVVKQLVERERPGTSICELDETCANFRGDVSLDGLSFVSGHAIMAWAIATILWPVLPGRWRWVPVVIAALNSVARVYLGAHNPLDVIGGAGVGVMIGIVLVFATGLVRPQAPADSSPTERPTGVS